jgi:PIN domain nuclease of toxin-antitoxin system
MINAVLDASALLAWLQDAPGAAAVEEVLSGNAMSSVNWAEVLLKSLAHGVDIADLREAMEALGLVIVAFDSTLAERVARLWLTHKTLSLAD